MRIGIVSDIHGNAPAMEAVASRLEAEADAVVFLGDLVGYYGLVDRCVACLDSLPVVGGVRGNHDQVLLDCVAAGTVPTDAYTSSYGSALARTLPHVLAPVAFLGTTQLTLRLELAGTVVALFHGAPWDPLEGRVYPDFAEWDRFRVPEPSLLLLGHTHHPMVVEGDGFRVVNPGSVGQPRDRSGAAEYAVHDTTSGITTLSRIPYDANEVLADVAANDPDVPYLREVLCR